MDLGTLSVTLGAPVGPLRRDLRKAKGTITSFAKGTRKSIKSATSSVLSLRTALVGLGAGVVINRLIKTADAMTLIEGRLKLVTDSTENLIQTQEDLLKVSNQTRSGFQETANLYARMARSTRQLDVSQRDLLQVTESINQAMIVSGATAVEASAALIQLSQGLASGELRGEELRSVMEQTPRLARAMADGLGLTIGGLRELGFAGELTAQKVITSLLSQRDVLDSEYRKMTMTVGQAFVVLGNTMDQIIKKVNESKGATRGLADEIIKVSEALNFLSNSSDVKELFKGLDADGLPSIADVMVTTLGAIAKAVALVSDAFRGWKMIWESLKVSWSGLQSFLVDGLIKLNDLLLDFIIEAISAALKVEDIAGEGSALQKGAKATALGLADVGGSLQKIEIELNDMKVAWDDVNKSSKLNLHTLKMQELSYTKTSKLVDKIKKDLSVMFDNMDKEREAARRDEAFIGFDILSASQAKLEAARAASRELIALTDDEFNAGVEAVAKMEDEYARFTDTIESEGRALFQDMFDNAGDAWDNFLERMEDMFLDTLFDMIFEAKKNEIIIPVVTDLVGGISKLTEQIVDIVNDALGPEISKLLGSTITGVSTFNAVAGLTGQSQGTGAQIGATVGSIAGSYFGPLGSAVGGFIGGSLGGLFDNNKEATVRGYLGFGTGEDFDILRNPFIDTSETRSFNFQDQARPDIGEAVAAQFEEAFNPALQEISDILNEAIERGVITEADIPADFLNFEFISDRLDHTPEQLEQSMNAIIDKWGKVLIDDTAPFISQVLEDMAVVIADEAQLGPFTALTERISGFTAGQKQPSMSELRASFDDLSATFDNLDQNSETFYDRALEILTEQVNLQEQIHALTQQQVSQMDDSIATLDGILADLDKNLGLPQSQAEFQSRFDQLVEMATTSTDPDVISMAIADLASFVPEFLAFQEAFGGDQMAFVESIREQLEEVREDLLVEKADLLANAFTNLTDAINTTTDSIVGPQAAPGDPAIGSTTINVNIDGTVTQTDVENILGDDEAMEALREAILGSFSGTRPGGF